MTRAPLLPLALAFVVTSCGGEEASVQADLPVADAPIEPVAPPEGREWSDVVVATDAGGHRMGNPDAAIEIIEFLSLTCGACASFDAEGSAPLEAYVDSGRVSYEIRNFPRDAVDMTATIISRCGGENSVFPLTHAMLGGQQQWFGSNLPAIQEVLAQSEGQSPAQQFPRIAQASGLKTFAVQRGLPASRIDACLADESAAERLVSLKGQYDADYVITGTPTFYMNGTRLEEWPWSAWEPHLKRALGEEVDAR